jgi:hypothetical protein
VERYVPALLVGAVAGHAVAGGVFTDPPPLEDPRVERFEQTTSGCRGTVTSAGGVSIGGGRFAAFGVTETDSPDADLSMAITRTSPEDARVTTYRVDLTSHAPDGNATCAGEVAYRLNVTVDSQEAVRVAVYEDGQVSACRGADCSEVMRDERRRWWANGSV